MTQEEMIEQLAELSTQQSALVAKRDDELAKVKAKHDEKILAVQAEHDALAAELRAEKIAGGLSEDEKAVLAERLGGEG
jgi:hypothetical protein